MEEEIKTITTWEAKKAPHQAIIDKYNEVK